MPHQCAKDPGIERNGLKHNTYMCMGKKWLMTVTQFVFEVIDIWLVYLTQIPKELYFHAQQKNRQSKGQNWEVFVSQFLSVRSRKRDGNTRLILSPTFSQVQNKTLEVPWGPALWSVNTAFTSCLDSPRLPLRECECAPHLESSLNQDVSSSN